MAWQKKYFLGVRIGINDYESAVEAAKNIQYVAFYISFGYLIRIIFGHEISVSVLDVSQSFDWRKYFSYAAEIVPFMVFVYLGLRIKGKKLGAVPVVASWMFLELAFGLYMTIAIASVIPIGFGLLAANGVRGWLAARQYERSI